MNERPLDTGPEETGGPRDQATSVDRRTALKVLAASAALGSAAACQADGAADPSSTDAAHVSLSGFDPLPTSNPVARGTPTDPDLLAPTVPWEGVLNDAELDVVRALCDLVIPADERSPAASDVGVPAYVNEYVSAPYPAQQEDLILVRGGLAWLN
ncbi:MAG: gluconate 2-dehydrogenase subunit 3 family protein, partial [Gemmatimonadota bacterium]|nr:gluconate 2-dehydrogenase subunit 3 family protein [Gemmatimonadota bacterium]